jgi:hypothetical protein
VVRRFRRLKMLKLRQMEALNFEAISGKSREEIITLIDQELAEDRAAGGLDQPHHVLRAQMLMLGLALREQRRHTLIMTFCTIVITVMTATILWLTWPGTVDRTVGTSGEEEGTIVKWGLFAGTLIAGFFFYWLRCRHRALYGASEILVAFLLISQTFFPHMPRVLGVGGDTFLDIMMPKTLSIFVGIYALVRGLDNINTGLGASTWRERWLYLRRAVWRQ